MVKSVCEDEKLPVVSVHYEKLTNSIVFTTRETFDKVEDCPEWYSYDRVDKANEYDTIITNGYKVRLIEAPEKNNTLIYYTGYKSHSSLKKEELLHFMEKLNIPEAQLFIKDREKIMPVRGMLRENNRVELSPYKELYQDAPITAAMMMQTVL